METFSPLIINSIIVGSTYALLVLGFNLIYGATKFFNVAHGAFAVVGGYAVLFFFKMLKLNLPLSVTAGIVCAGTLGLLSDKIIFSPLRKRQASGVIMFVASLGLLTAIQSVIAMLFTNEFQILTESFLTKNTYKIFNGVITDVHIAIIISIIAITSCLMIMLKKTKFGTAVKAVSDDEEVAKILGINSERIINKVFLLGSAIAGLGGILIGFDLGLTPTMGMGLLLKAVTAAIIGGAGNIYGGLSGAFLLGFAENLGSWKLSGEWTDAIAFLLLIIFLIFRRHGIMGR